MEEHHYGGPADASAAGGGGVGQEGPSPAAAPTSAARPNGWSSLTRLLRNPSSPPRDRFPPLLGSTTSGENHHQAQAQNQNQPTASGERSQQQRGVSSPASSTGSFSSNHNSGRNQHQRGGGGGGHHLADAQAALSSNAAGAPGQRGFPGIGNNAGGGSPPESSSGSFAPNSSLVNNQHVKRDRQHRGHHNHLSRGSGPASSAGSFSLNPYPYRVQSGAYDAANLGGGFQLGGAHNGRGEREVTGGLRMGNVETGANSDAQVGLPAGGQASNGYERPPQKREFHAYELVVDEGRRDEASAAERDVKPAVSDGRSSIGDADRDVNNGAHEQQGKDAGDSTAASSAFHVPMEPEWEEEDLYLRVRSDALKEARARDKFARGASQAYVRGDHRKAKILSKQAGEKRLLAEKLHAEAAAKILDQRNKQQGSFDIWHLDLHGLHSSEAVAALESRLALLEHGLAEDHRLGVGPSAISLEEGVEHDDDGLLEQNQELLTEAAQRQQQQDPKHKLFQSLSIVTGVGAHSQGGPTLPSAVKSFLINNGYHLEEPRAGVVSVRPKLRFSV